MKLCQDGDTISPPDGNTKSPPEGLMITPPDTETKANPPDTMALTLKPDNPTEEGCFDKTIVDVDDVLNIQMTDI